MSTEETEPTPEQLADAKALREQAAELLRRAEELDGKTPSIVFLDWGDGEPSIYIEYTAEDLTWNSVEDYMQKHYQVSGFHNHYCFDMSIIDLAGARA